MSRDKKAYFQGGGGANEPTPGKKKYKSDMALMIQSRFKEPIYHNYDIYQTGDVTGGPYHYMNQYNSISKFLGDKGKYMVNKYTSTDDFWIEDNWKNYQKRIDRMKIRASQLTTIKIAHFQGVNGPDPKKIKYKGEPNILVQPRIAWCDDANMEDDPKYFEWENVKTAGRNFDYGTGLYDNLDRYDSVKDFINKHDQNEDHMMPPKEHGTSIYDWKNSPYQGKPKAPKRDSNHIDFQYDSIDAKPHAGPIIGDSENYSTPIQLGPTGPPDDITISPGQVNLGDFESYPYGAQLGGMYDKYLGKYDLDDKPESTLDWSNDLPESTEAPGSHSFESVHENEESPVDNKKDKLDELEKKYLNPIPAHGLYGLPDGVDLPDEDLGDPTDIQPDYGTLGPESKMYEDKWNI